MADRGPRSGPRQGDFLWIKQGLDPKASYVIFEQNLTLQENLISDSSHPVFGFLEAKGLSWQQVEDPNLAMAYLVVRVPPGDEDKVLGKILGYGFPEDIVFYIFKAEEV